MLHAVAAAQDGVLTRTQALTSLTAKQVEAHLSRGDWRPLGRGVYLTDAWAYDAPPRRATLRAALLLGGPGAVLGLAAAAEVHDLPRPQRTAATVDVYVPGRRPGPLVPRDDPWFVRPRWQGRRLLPNDVTAVEGLPATTVRRTLADWLPELARLEVLSVADAALHREALSPVDIAALATRYRRRGRSETAAVLDLADPGGQSPLESRTRLILVDAGLAPDALQYVVTGRGGEVLGRADMAWLRGRRTLLVECDGAAYHGSPEAVHHDRFRQNGLVLAGCQLVRFTWRDSERPAYIRAVVRQWLEGVDVERAG